MHVGLYIDGFNLYYGGRGTVGRSVSGWRWLDIRLLGERLLARRADWASKGAVLSRVVYCTAYIDGNVNPDGNRDQAAYVNALRRNKSFDQLELGKYVSSVKTRPLAVRQGGAVRVVESGWPVMVQSNSGLEVPDARFIVSYLHMEEKGSDVNVASHLLSDVLQSRIDAAMVISNDSDLRYPIQTAREHVPVGTVNPSKNYTAGDLRGNRADGAGGHWWYSLVADDFTSCQLPQQVHGVNRPPGW